MSGIVLHPAPAIVPGGVLAFVPIGDSPRDAAERLEPAELELAGTVSPARRDAFVAGRMALRAAVHAVSPRLSHAPLLRTGRGAPLLPHGLSGSISHKRTRAVAIAAPHDETATDARTGARVGIDLERRPHEDSARRPDDGRALARRILTPREQEGIAALDDIAHRDAALLHFALKEAVYKAIDPFVERYVRFTEVEIEMAHAGDVLHAGTAGVQLLLPELAGAPMSAQVAWYMEPDWIVAIAVARRL